MSDIDVARNGMFYWVMESYLALREHGEEGIRQWQEAMERGLHAGYTNAGAKKNSGLEAFLKYVVQRDMVLGLPAGGNIINDNSFRYWIRDFFLPLRYRGVSAQEYADNISTGGYVESKRRFFVPDYSVRMVRNSFESEDGVSEWVFERER